MHAKYIEFDQRKNSLIMLFTVLSILGLFIRIGLTFEQDAGKEKEGAQYNQRWYAGGWSVAPQFAWGFHPLTVAIRFDIVDSRSLIGVQNVSVKLRGSYKLEHHSLHGVERIEWLEWELSAITEAEHFDKAWQNEIFLLQVRYCILNKDSVPQLPLCSCRLS